MTRALLRLRHKRCLACVIMAALPVLHLLEGVIHIPHGLEAQLEAFALTLASSE